MPDDEIDDRVDHDVDNDVDHDADHPGDGGQSDPGQWPGDDLLPGDEGPPVAPAGPPRRKSGGSMLGAAMLGLQQALYGKPQEETVIEVETSGDPPNIDVDGLDEQFSDDSRLVGPPLDDIKARRRPTRPSRSSRSSRSRRRGH